MKYNHTKPTRYPPLAGRESTERAIIRAYRHGRAEAVAVLVDGIPSLLVTARVGRETKAVVI